MRVEITAAITLHLCLYNFFSVHLILDSLITSSFIYKTLYFQYDVHVWTTNSYSHEFRHLKIKYSSETSFFNQLHFMNVVGERIFFFNLEMPRNLVQRKNWRLIPLIAMKMCDSKFKILFYCEWSYLVWAN